MPTIVLVTLLQSEHEASARETTEPRKTAEKTTQRLALILPLELCKISFLVD